MERFFVLGDFNTWIDWGLILTSKDVTPPEPKTNYINIDGMSGSLDLSESLTGDITYQDRTVTATFWTDEGSYADREKLINNIVSELHGKKIKIIEPDTPHYYFYGRVVIKERHNNKAYAEFKIECICDPWRYSLQDTTRTVSVDNLLPIHVVLRNGGAKKVYPTVKVDGSVKIEYKDITIELTSGEYSLPDLKLEKGFNIVDVSGTGTLIITYKEADL